jgi:hypothetical protein
MKLQINGTFELPKGTPLLEALLRFGVFLKQIAMGGETTQERWHGNFQIVEDEAT